MSEARCVVIVDGATASISRKESSEIFSRAIDAVTIVNGTVDPTDGPKFSR